MLGMECSQALPARILAERKTPASRQVSSTDLCTLRTAFQSLLVARIIPQGADAKIAENWRSWPIAMIPIAIIGLTLCARLWNARPQKARHIEHQRRSRIIQRLRAKEPQNQGLTRRRSAPGRS
jgi:hypothetical protein